MQKIVPMLALLAVLAGATGARAQDADGMTFPYTPAAEDCQIEPRTVDEILGLTGISTAGAQAASGEASPPDAGTPGPRDRAIATVQELAACIVAGDMLRSFALFSDGYLERLPQRTGAALEDDLLLNAIWAIQGQFFLGDESWAPSLAGFLEASDTGSPVATGVTGSIQAVPAVWELGGDRVAVAATVQGLFCFMQCDLVFILAPDESTGRYLIDDAIEIFDLSEVPSG